VFFFDGKINLLIGTDLWTRDRERGSLSFSVGIVRGCLEDGNWLQVASSGSGPMKSEGLAACTGSSFEIW